MPRRRPPRRPNFLLRRIRRRGTTALIVALLAAGLVLADRNGWFGQAPPDDLAAFNGAEVRVVAVVDGDTIDISRDGGPTTRVRLWGVDTPETVAPGKPVQHFGPEASAFTRKLVLHQVVRLEMLERRPRDKYDRLLAYVHLADGRVLNRVLVAEGYAYADPRFDHPYAAEFKKLQSQAISDRKGLWEKVRRADLPYYYQDLRLPQ